MIQKAVFVSCLFIAGNAWSGGHFDVDDAFTLDPGRCQYETWWARSKTDASHATHLGPACRIGPAEIGLGVDRVRGPDEPQNIISPQLKWTFIDAGNDGTVSAAIVMGFARDFAQHGKPGHQFLLPVSLRASNDLLIHVNLGTDWSTTEGVRSQRRGLAAEWAWTEQFTLISERNLASGRWTSGAGLRLAVAPLLSLDISLARSGPDSVRTFVIGVNHEFGR